jgi:hypothetical protein
VHYHEPVFVVVHGTDHIRVVDWLLDHLQSKNYINHKGKFLPNMLILTPSLKLVTIRIKISPSSFWPALAATTEM